MTKKQQLRDVLLACLATFVCVLIYHCAGLAIEKAIPNEIVSSFISQALFAVLVFLAVILLKQTDLFRYDRSLLRRGWLSAGLYLFLILFSAVTSLYELLNSSASLLEWVLFILQVFSSGSARRFCSAV